MPVTVAEQVCHLPVCVNPLESCSGVAAVASSASELVMPPPTRPPVLVKFTAVSCGAQFSLALDRSGGVWAWGGGEGGVLGLGLGGMDSRSFPARVEALREKPIASVTCGSYHA